MSADYDPARPIIHTRPDGTEERITDAEADARCARGERGRYIDTTPEDPALAALKRRFGITRRTE